MSSDDKKHAQIPEAAGVGISMEDAQKEMEARHGPGMMNFSPADVYKKDLAKAEHTKALAEKAKLGKDEFHTQETKDDK